MTRKSSRKSAIVYIGANAWRDLRPIVACSAILVVGQTPGGAFPWDVAQAIAWERAAQIDGHDTPPVFRFEEKGIPRLNVMTALAAARVPFVAYGTGLASAFSLTLEAWRMSLRQAGIDPLPATAIVQVDPSDPFPLPWRRDGGVARRTS